MFGLFRSKQERREIREASQALMDHLLPTVRNQVAYHHLIDTVVPGAQAMVERWEADRESRSQRSSFRNATDLVLKDRLVMAATALSAGAASMFAADLSLPVGATFVGIAGLAAMAAPGRMTDAKLDSAIREGNRLIKQASKAAKSHLNCPANEKNDRHFSMATHGADALEAKHKGQPPIGMSLSAFLKTIGSSETLDIIRRVRADHEDDKTIQNGLDRLVADAGPDLDRKRTARFRELVEQYETDRETFSTPRPSRQSLSGGGPST